jgi:hypothetical protein
MIVLGDIRGGTLLKIEVVRCEVGVYVVELSTETQALTGKLSDGGGDFYFVLIADGLDERKIGMFGGGKTICC